jgi:hypothetical protein
MKKIISIFLVASSFSSFAENCINCSGELKPFEGLVKNVESLQEAAVVNCSDELKKAARDEYQKNFGGEPIKRAVIKGVSLEGSADELKFLTKMLGENSIVNLNDYKECSTAICALSKIYKSEEAAHRAFNIAKRDGYIVSIEKEFKTDKGMSGQIFSLEELQKIDLAYKRLPEKYRKIKTLDRLKRMPDGYGSPDSPNAAAWARPGYHSGHYHIDGEIVFLDSGIAGDGAWGSQVAVHELTHHLDFASSQNSYHGISESPEFLNLSGWKKKSTYVTDEKTGKKKLQEQWDRPKDKAFVRDYAGSAPAEDFAESTAYYMLQPQYLKTIDPEKYNFIKSKVFNGQEFINSMNFPFNKDELMKSCLASAGELKFYTNGPVYPQLSASCLSGYINNIKITDPNWCSYHKDIIKTFLNDQIASETNKLNADFKACHAQIENNIDMCSSEGNFQSRCATDKCNLDESLKSKITYFSMKNLKSSPIKNAGQKLGREKFLSAVLINGLKKKDKISADYELYYQQDFLDDAATGIIESFKKEGYKFDEADITKKKGGEFLMMDKETSGALSSFQKEVLKNASKSKEKNLELIKAWAAKQNLKETEMDNELADTMTKYGKGFFGI